MSGGFKLADAYVNIHARNLMAEVLAPAIASLRGVAAAEAEVGVAAGLMGARAKLALLGLGVVAVGAAVGLAKMAGDFEQATMRLVTSAGETHANLGLVRDGILGLAGDVGYSAGELAKAMYKVESGGQHGAAGLTTLKAAAQGAKAEGADLTTVSDALTSAMTDYHAPASAAADITSKLVAATAHGKMTFQELAGSLAAVLPVASANHVSLNDILGDLAAMTVHGMSAQQASQNLADSIRHLAAPTQMQQKQFALLGMTSQQVSADLGSKGLSGVTQELSQAIMKGMGPESSRVVLSLQTALKGLSPSVQELGQKAIDGTISWGEYRKAAQGLPVELQGNAIQFANLAKSTHAIGNEQMSGEKVLQTYSGALRQAMGDATGMNVALMLTGENSGITATAISAVTAATADAQGNVLGWSDIQGTFNTKLSMARDGLEAFGISIGTKLLPFITPVVGALADMTSWLSKNQTVATVAAGIIGGVVVVALSAAAVAAWSFTAALLANPAVWIVAGIVAAIVGLVVVAKLVIDNWSGISAFFVDLWSKVTGAFAAAGSAIMGALAWIAGLPGKVVGWLGGLGGMLVDLAVRAWQMFTAPFVAGWQALSAFFALGPKEMGRRIGSAIGDLISAGVALVTGFGNAVRTGFLATVAWVQSVPGRVLSALSALGGFLLRVATDGWHLFLSTTTSVVSSVVSFVQQLPGRILAFLSALPGRLSSAASLAWQLFVSSSISAANAIWGFVSGIPGRVMGALGDLGGLLLGAGRAIIGGLLSGLKNAVGGLWDFVSGIAGGIAERKGPLPYDRQLLVPAGNAIMNGLLQGLESGHERVMDFVGGVASDVADGIPTDLPFNVSMTRSRGSDGASLAGTAAGALRGGAADSPGAGRDSGGVTNIYVTATPSNPMETGRYVALALRGTG